MSVFVLGRSVANVSAIVECIGVFCGAGWLVGGVVWKLVCGEWNHPHVGVVTFGCAHDSGVVMCYGALFFGEVHLTPCVAEGRHRYE